MIPKCIRCGVCCLLGPCELGKVNYNGICIYLTYDGERTSCLLVSKGVMPYFIGSGCFFRENEDIYNSAIEVIKSRGINLYWGSESRGPVSLAS